MSPHGRPLLEIVNLSVEYGDGTLAIDGVNLSLPEKGLVLILGSTGSGKTTLALTMCGLIPRSIPARVSGRILLEGVPLDEIPLRRLRREITMVLQDPDAQLLRLSVLDEVRLPLALAGEPDAEAIAERALRRLRLWHRRDAYSLTLSYGERQRLAIAFALALRPRILILDEPLAHQDPWARAELRRIVAELKDELCVVVLEHRFEELLPLADLVVVLDRGSKVFEGPPEAFSSSPWASRLLPRIPARRGRAGRVVLKARRLSFSYDGHRVLRGVDLEVREGELVAVVGPNGAGKSTLGMLLAGLLEPEAGEVTVDGKALLRIPPGERASLAFYVPQDPNLLFAHDSALAEVRHEFVLRGLRPDEAEHAAPSLLQELGLGELARKHPLALSRGQRVLLAIAIALARSPKVLILDEPFSGQDGASCSKVIELLCAARRTIVLITHEEDIAHRIADRVLMLKDGVLREVRRACAS